MIRMSDSEKLDFELRKAVHFEYAISIRSLFYLLYFSGGGVSAQGEGLVLDLRDEGDPKHGGSHRSNGQVWSQTQFYSFNLRCLDSLMH